MRIIWTPEAGQDRTAIWDYLETRDRDAALRIDRLLGDAVARLADFPMLGHQGEIAGTRELTPHRSYRLSLGGRGRCGMDSRPDPHGTPLAPAAALLIRIVEWE